MKPIITEMSSGKHFKAYVEGNPEVYEYGKNESVAVAKLLLRLQGVKFSVIDGGTLFATLMWICWVALSWRLIEGLYALDTFNTMMWGLFLLFGIFGSAFASRR